MCSPIDFPPYDAATICDDGCTCRGSLATCDTCGLPTDHSHAETFLDPIPTVYELTLPVIDGRVWTPDGRLYAAPAGPKEFLLLYPDHGALVDEVEYGLGDGSWEASTRWIEALRGGHAMFHSTQLVLGLE